MDTVVVTYEQLAALAARVTAVARGVERLRSEAALRSLAVAVPLGEVGVAADELASSWASSRSTIADALHSAARSLRAAADTYRTVDR